MWESSFVVGLEDAYTASVGSQSRESECVLVEGIPKEFTSPQAANHRQNVPAHCIQATRPLFGGGGGVKGWAGSIPASSTFEPLSCGRFPTRWSTSFDV